MSEGKQVRDPIGYFTGPKNMSPKLYFRTIRTMSDANIQIPSNEFVARSAYEFGRSFLGYERGIVVVINVYMDESGIDDGNSAVATSAVWARPSIWQSWTRDWCREKRPIEIYHASECHNRKGEFDGWSREDRDALVKRLLPIVPRHRLRGCFAGVHLDAYNQAIAGKPDLYRETFGSPYLATITWAFKHVFEQVMKTNGRRVAIVHEVSASQTEISQSFESTVKRFPELNATLSFGFKHQYVPLQAADLIAYEGFRFLKGDSAPRKPLEALDPDGSRIGWVYYDRKNIGVLANGVQTYLDEMFANKLRSRSVTAGYVPVDMVAGKSE